MTINLEDISVDSVHVDSASKTIKPQGLTATLAELTSKKRNDLSKNQFADPAERKYPIHDKAHADNAMARLEQQRSSMSTSKYSAIRSRIRAAQKRFGESSPAQKQRRMSSGGKGLTMKIHPDGGIHIRHMSEDDKCVAFLPLVEIKLGDDND